MIYFHGSVFSVERMTGLIKQIKDNIDGLYNRLLLNSALVSLQITTVATKRPRYSFQFFFSALSYAWQLNINED
jgi:hypothetical protein